LASRSLGVEKAVGGGLRGGRSTSGAVGGAGSIGAGVVGSGEGLGRVCMTKQQHFTPVESTLRRDGRACYDPCSGQMGRRRQRDS